MTSAIEIPGYVTVVSRERAIADLAVFAAGLLAHHADLPAPRYFNVSQGAQEIRLGFGDSPESFRTLALWAERFGGTVTAAPYTSDDGRESIHAEIKFVHQGVDVEGYAFITTEAETATF